MDRPTPSPEELDGDRAAEVVRSAHAAGYHLVPVAAGGKAAHTRWAGREFPLDLMLAHARSGGNIAARVGATRTGIQVAVVDRDSRCRETWEFVRSHGLHRSTMQVETASGNWHLWFSVPREVEDLRTRIRLVVRGQRLPVDLKATGYVLLPGSRIGEDRYQFRDGKGLKRPEDLLPLPESFLALVRTPRPPTVPTAIDTGRRPRTGAVRDPERYVLCIGSHQGSNGSAGLVRAVCVLRDAGRTARETCEYLVNVWNRPPRVIPPWSVIEIERAVRRHFHSR